MIGRCSDPAHKDYPAYGGRGLSVAERWLDFETFRADMGPRPKGHLLDRVDNARGYSLRNCRWADAKLSSQNRRHVIWIEWQGARKTLSDWARWVGYDISNLHKYWKKGGEPAVVAKLAQLSG